MQVRVLKKSVREFVELVLSSGSLDNRFTSNARAIEGVKAHQKLQKSNAEVYKKYEKEVFLKLNIDMDIFILDLEGRCDGIIIEGNDVIVEEIKSTYKPLYEIEEDYNVLHWAQAKLYGYMLCKERDIDNIYVQLSYYNLDTNEVKSFRKSYSVKELYDFLMSMVKLYHQYAELDYNHKKKRNESIKNLQFPFTKYRKGQLELAKSWYSTIKEGNKIFAQAPTGIGKTVSTIFPAIKAVGEGLGERIFYLTAKNVNRKVAEETLEKLRDKGLIYRTVTLVAKDKICINDKVSCNPDDCIYAKGYYDKVKNVIYSILMSEYSISREILCEFGEKYEVCPFELALDLINWSDGVICDYNYIFDPRVYLRRVLDESGKDNILLIDESHNLVDRGRDMYTARLLKSKFMQLRKEIKGKCPTLYKALNKINSFFIEEKRICESEDKGYYYTKDEPKEIYKLLRNLMKEADEFLTQGDKYSFNEDLLELYFDCSKFLTISELYGEEYFTYVELKNDDVELCIYCVNPSEKIKGIVDKVKASIFFSATLEPFHYFIKSLGGSSDDYRIRLSSPFPKENLEVYLYAGNTRYKQRERTLPSICNEINKFIREVEGNYMVFFPSYEYMYKAYDFLKECISLDRLMIQSGDMDEESKEKFLNEFSGGRNNIALCVMGGSFSEGVDLPGEKLIGAVIVGVGYPKISLERELIKEYYNSDGDAFSYIYPGMNKVMQAVGRVIRTEEDKGRILLIDDRYLSRAYSELLPSQWNIIKR